MKFKRIILILFLGVIIGLSLSPFSNEKPKQAIISPIPVTNAETKNFISPLASGEVLGEAKEAKLKLITKSQFKSIINQGMKNKPNKNKQTKKIIKKTSFIQSSYKGEIRIAAVGDSITDLMGENLPYLEKELKKYYPQASFNLFNYGVGAENIEQGLNRIKNDYDYKGRHYLALASIKPNIVIIESFGYNPFSNSEGEINRHWSDLAKIVDFVKVNTSAKIIMLAGLAPAKAKFGQGPNGVNWPPNLAWRQAERINQYLENTVNFSHSANLPLVDIYHQTLLVNGEGNPAYINSADHIHQNEKGNKLMARLLAGKIFSLRLF